MKPALLVALLASLAGISSACGSGRDAGSANSAVIALDTFGLVVDGVAGSEVSESLLGNSARMCMIAAPGLVFSVSEPLEGAPVTIEEAVAMWTKIYKGAKITRQAKTADGYQLEFQTKASLGDEYNVQIGRTIDGTPYICGTTALTQKAASAVVAACQSLRAK